MKVQLGTGHERHIDMNDWLSADDVIGTITEVYNNARDSGHLHETALAKAAALLAIRRDEFAHPALSTSLSEKLIFETRRERSTQF